MIHVDKIISHEEADCPIITITPKASKKFCVGVVFEFYDKSHKRNMRCEVFTVVNVQIVVLSSLRHIAASVWFS
jgi:hypothetical protein